MIPMHFLNWDSLHARLNSHYKAWYYKKKKQRKIKVTETDMRYFTKSKFSRGLVQKKNFSLI